MWKKGTIVKPDKIRKLLKSGDTASHGLYFYTSKPPRAKNEQQTLIVAQVQTRNIIAADSYGTICCTKARVIQAFSCHPQQIIIDKLDKQLETAKNDIKERDREMKEWLEEKDDYLEALQLLEQQKQLLEEQLAKITKKRGK